MCAKCSKEYIKLIGTKLPPNKNIILHLGTDDFTSIWQACCERSFLHLREKELDSIMHLADVLGKYDVETQASAIHDCVCCIKSSSAHDSSRFPEFKRLSFGLSITLASIFAIMMF